MDDRHFSYITKIGKKKSPWNFRLPAMGGERGSSSSSSSRALAADESASLRSCVSCCFSAVCSFVCALRARSVVPLILLATRCLLWFCGQLGEGEKERKNRVTFSFHQLLRWGSLSPSCFRGSSPSRRCAFSW